MNAAAQQDIMMNQFEKPRVVPGTSGAVLLNECRDLAASLLPKALSTMMDKAVEEFLELSENSLNGEMRSIYMNAMTLVRDKRSVIEPAFRLQFLQNFNKEIRRGSQIQNENAPDALELSLVSPDDLEESLASGNISNSIQGECAEELFGIEKRMGVLLQDPDLLNTNNPLGPEVIGKAFMGSMKELDCPVKIKLLLGSLFSKHMPRQIKAIYQDINQHLVEKGVLEKIRVGTKKKTEPAAAAPRPVADAAGQETPSAGGQGGLFAALQQFLTQGVFGRMGAGQGAGAGSGEVQMGAGQDHVAVSALTRLQHGQMEGVTAGAGGALDASQFANGNVNVLREIKSSSVAGTLGQVDAMTLDIVAMLFDYILDDRRIPDAMKALIGRLQIPVLKVAMLDKTFFSQKSHPVRKLLDRLAEVSIGWNESEGHQGGLYQMVEGLIQRVLNDFDDQVGIFTELLSGLEQYLEEEKRRADVSASLSAQHLHHREQEEIARVMAHEEIGRRIHSAQLPEVIGHFLISCWQGVLAAEYVKAGEDGESWKRAIETMDELIWSAMPKRLTEDRKRLVSLLPSLLMRLQAGMAQVAFANAERDQFFSWLVKCHADAVKSGLNAAAQEEAVPTAFVAQAFDAAEAAEMVQQAVEPSDFVEIPSPQDIVEPDATFVQALSGESDGVMDAGWQTLTIGNAGAWQGPRETPGDDYDAMVKKIKRGTWIEFGQKSGEPARVKLAWVSPLKGLYLFTNRLGEQAVSISPAGLAGKLRNGQAQIIDDIALMDRAVNSLMEKLEQAA